MFEWVVWFAFIVAGVLSARREYLTASFVAGMAPEALVMAVPQTQVRN